MYAQMMFNDFSENERMMFMQEMRSVEKSATVAILLCLFLGGLGGHRFYMDRIGLGVLSVLFFWTFIPAIIAFIELFFLSGRVNKYNEAQVEKIILRIKAMRTVPSS